MKQGSGCPSFRVQYSSFPLESNAILYLSPSARLLFSLSCRMEVELKRFHAEVTRSSVALFYLQVEEYEFFEDRYLLSETPELIFRVVIQ